MRADYTHILYILDRSGSMSTVQNDVRHGFDTFIADQKKLEGKCTLTLVQFDDQYQIDCDFRDIHSVPSLDFMPRGFTALYDAIGRAMRHTGERLASMPEAERPAKVLVIIHTDGEENGSNEYRKHMIGEMIKHQEEKYQWKVAFIGTNFDVMGEGRDLGVNLGGMLHYQNNSRGIATAYSVVSSSVAALRNCDQMSYTANTFFSNEEQQYVNTVK